MPPDRYFLMGVGVAGVLAFVGQIWGRGICSSNGAAHAPVWGGAARSYKSLLWPEFQGLNCPFEHCDAAVGDLYLFTYLCTPWRSILRFKQMQNVASAWLD